MRTIIIGICSLFFLLAECPTVRLAFLGAQPVCAAEVYTTPRFFWSSFQFFWNKNAPPLVQLKEAQKVTEGYFCDFGHTVSVTTLVEDEIVTGVRIRYVGGPGYDAGGPKFTRLVNHAIKVGSFRWPAEVLKEVREHYRMMLKMTRDFRYRSTFFRMEHNIGTGWTFTFKYLDS